MHKDAPSIGKRIDSACKNLPRTTYEPGFHLGVVSLVMSSWGNGVRADTVVARNMHSCAVSRDRLDARQVLVKQCGPSGR